MIYLGDAPERGPVYVVTIDDYLSTHLEMRLRAGQPSSLTGPLGIQKCYLLFQSAILGAQEDTNEGFSYSVSTDRLWELSEDHVFDSFTDYKDMFDWLRSNEIKLQPYHVANHDSGMFDCTIMMALLDARERNWSSKLLNAYLDERLPLAGEFDIQVVPTGGFHFRMKPEGKTNKQRVSLVEWMATLQERYAAA